MRGSGRRGSGRLIIPVVLAGLGASTGAMAASPVEDALEAAVAAIDDAPLWTARYQRLTYEASSDTAVLLGLVIGLEQERDFAVEFDSIRVTGFAESGGGWEAGDVVLGTARVVSPVMGATLSGVELRGLSVPDFSGVALDPARPFTSMIKAYGVAATTALAHASIDRLSFTQTVAGETTEVVYNDMVVNGMQQGRIASMETGRLSMTTPSPEGLFRFAMRRFEATDYDLNGFVEVFDPDQYSGGFGDLRWRRVLGSATYRDVSLEAPGAVVRFGEMHFGEMRLRQPPTPFSAYLDQAILNPNDPELEEMGPVLGLNIMAAIGLGRFSIRDLDVASIGIDRFRLGEFYFDELSLDGLEAIGVRDVDVAVPGEAAIRLGGFALGDITFPSFVDMQRAIEASIAGRDPRDPLALVPHLGFAEASELDLALAGQSPVRLEHARLDLGAYIRVIPTAVTLSVTGFDLPLDVLETVVDMVSGGPDAVAFPTDIVRQLGYDRLTMDYGFDARWNEADTSVQLTDLHLAIAEMGRIGIDLGFSGISRRLIERFDRPSTRPPELMFEGLKLTLTDESLFGRVLDYAAERLNVSPEQLKATMLVTLPFQLVGIVPDAALRTQIMQAAQGFIREPGTLTIRIDPKGEVPLAALSALEDPAAIAELFSVSVESTPSGSGGSAPAEEDAPADGDAPGADETPAIE